MAKTLMEFMGMGGQGMARQAANTLADTNAYRKYVTDTQTQGEKPMTMDEFMLLRNAPAGGLLGRN